MTQFNWSVINFAWVPILPLIVVAAGAMGVALAAVTGESLPEAAGRLVATRPTPEKCGSSGASCWSISCA